MWKRLRAIGMWFVTGFDDFVLERFWPRLKRGEFAAAFSVWTELFVGFWGCAVVILLVLFVAVITASVL
jgi:hypothetical protein